MQSLKAIQEEPLALLYFWQSQCGVCQALEPKVADLVSQHFNQLPFFRLKADEHKAFMGQLRMLSVPGILLLAQGKELYRANGLVHLKQLESKIAPAYAAFYN